MQPQRINAPSWVVNMQIPILDLQPQIEAHWDAFNVAFQRVMRSGHFIMGPEVKSFEEEAAALVWHKIVCRKPPGTISQGRSTYSHMLCVSLRPRPTPIRPGPDVLADAGYMPWSRAIF